MDAYAALSDRKWFCLDLSRVETEARLSGAAEGAFVVRRSSQAGTSAVCFAVAIEPLCSLKPHQTRSIARVYTCQLAPIHSRLSGVVARDRRRPDWSRNHSHRPDKRLLARDRRRVVSISVKRITAHRSPMCPRRYLVPHTAFVVGRWCAPAPSNAHHTAQALFARVSARRVPLGVCFGRSWQVVRHTAARTAARTDVGNTTTLWNRTGTVGSCGCSRSISNTIQPVSCILLEKRNTNPKHNSGKWLFSRCDNCRLPFFLFSKMYVCLTHVLHVS